MICSPQGPIQHRIREMGWVAIYPDEEDDDQLALQWEVVCVKYGECGLPLTGIDDCQELT